MLCLDINFDDDKTLPYKTLPMLDLDENTATVVGSNMHSLILRSDWDNVNSVVSACKDSEKDAKKQTPVCKDCAAKMEDFIHKPYSFYFETSEKKYAYWPERELKDSKDKVEYYCANCGMDRIRER